MLDASRGIGAAHAARRPGAGAGRAAPRRIAGGCATQLAPLRRQDGKPAFTQPGRLPRPEESDFPQRLAALAAMLAAGLPLRCVAITAPGDYDTHANQAETAAARTLQLTCDALARVPARPRGARARRPRARARVVGVRPPRGRERLEGTDHGAAGLGLLIGTRAAGRMIGEFPGLDDARRGRQPARDLGLPRRLRRAARAVARHRRGGHRPRRRARSRGRSWSSEGAAGSARARRGPGGRRRAARGRRSGAHARHRRRVEAARPRARRSGRAGCRSRSTTAARTRTTSSPGASTGWEGGWGGPSACGRRRRGSWPRPPGRCRSGQYRLWCTLREHEAAGMRATLRVR